MTDPFPHSRLFTLVSTVLLLAGASCSQAPGNRLTIGMELNYPPFEMIDAQGKPAGISVDLAGALAQTLGRELKIDLIISSMTATPERAESIDFSEPYLRTGLALLVNKSAAIHVIADADRPNITLAVKQGTTGQIYAQAHLQQAHLLVLDKEDACVLEVLQNKAQAFIYDQMSVFKHWQGHRDQTEALLRPFQEEHWAVGVRKGNDRLRGEVNAFLERFRTDGGFDRLGNKYLGEQKEAFQKLGIPFYF
jgi:polar amino acid transport system substrate-binding protein